MQIKTNRSKFLFGLMALFLIAGCNPSNEFLNSKINLILEGGKFFELTVTPKEIYDNAFKKDPNGVRKLWKSVDKKWILIFEQGNDKLEIHFALNEGRVVATHAVISGQKLEGEKFIGFIVGIADSITSKTGSK